MPLRSAQDSMPVAIDDSLTTARPAAVDDYTTRLPTEMFFSILDQLCPCDIITSAHVCHRWRDVAVHHPGFYATLRLEEFQGRVEVLAHFCDQLRDILSRNMPVVLDVRLRDHNFAPAPQILDATRQLLRTISDALPLAIVLALSLPTWPPYLHSEALQSLGRPAPLLRRLELRLRGEGNIAVPSNLFGGMSPRLENVLIYRVALPTEPCPAFFGILRLALCKDHLAQLGDIPRHFPSLISLELDIGEMDDVQMTLPPAGFRLRMLFLNGVFLRGPWPPPLRGLLQSRAVQRVDVLFFPTSSIGESLFTETLTPPLEVRVRERDEIAVYSPADGCSRTFIASGDEDLYQLIVDQVHAESSPSVTRLRSQWSNLRHLAYASVAFPRVHTFEIQMDDSQLAHDLTEHDNFAWPALRTLILSNLDYRPTVISASQLLALTAGLRLSDKLADITLILDNVELQPEEDLEALRAIFERVELPAQSG